MIELDIYINSHCEERKRLDPIYEEMIKMNIIWADTLLKRDG